MLRLVPPNVFSKVVASNYTPSSQVEEEEFLKLIHTCMGSPFNFSHFGVVWYLIVVLIHISLMTNDVEHTY